MLIYFKVTVDIFNSNRGRFLSKNLEMKILILPVVLYGCKTWSLTSRKEFRLRVGQL